MRTLALTAALVVLSAAAVLATPLLHTAEREAWVTRHLAERRIATAMEGSLGALATAERARLEALSCPKCKEIMAVVEIIGAESKAAQNKTLGTIDFICELKFHKADEQRLCKLAAAIVLDLAHVLVDGTAKGLDWNFPLTMCSNVVHACKQPCCTKPNVPEQIQLSFASKTIVAVSTSMRVSWVTLEATPGDVVQWRVGETGAWASAPAMSRTYTRGGWVGVNHGAVMTGLLPATAYEYRVGVAGGVMSPIFRFTTLPLNAGSAERPLRVVTYGDMGFGPNSEHNRARLLASAQAKELDFIVHHGDVSYADGDEQHWDVYFREMQPITSQVPYMTTPGNHELYWNFTAYKSRMWMPQPGDGAPADGMYYAFDAAGFKFVAVDTETQIDTADIAAPQRRWIDTQLSRADAAQQSAILFQHRPLYCTNRGTDCGIFATLLQSQVEGMLVRHRSARLLCSAHMHDYERTFPVAAGGNNISHTMVDPVFPTHVINGAGGNREGITSFDRAMPWTASRVPRWGLNHLTLYSNGTANVINGRFVVGEDNSVADAFTIVQHK